MANISETESKFLNELVRDCITYRLSENEALQYIEFRFKKISEASYKSRKSHLLSDKSAQIWLNYFTRIGFVMHHKEQIETIQKIQDDSLKQLSIETGKETRDEVKIRCLKHDIRQDARLLSELGLGTPIIAAIKKRLDDARKARLNPE